MYTMILSNFKSNLDKAGYNPVIMFKNKLIKVVGF